MLESLGQRDMWEKTSTVFLPELKRNEQNSDDKDR
jgi:hypothetical protein